MLIEVAKSTENLIAFITRVRQVSCVTLQVACQVTTIDEAAPTLGTLMGFEPCTQREGVVMHQMVYEIKLFNWPLKPEKF